MVRLTVLYGHPADPAAFEKYYHEVHLPLARQMKGIKGWTIGKCETLDGSRPEYFMIVGIYADSRADLEAMIASPQGQAAVADVPNFATGGATFLLDDEQVLEPYSLS